MSKATGTLRVRDREGELTEYAWNGRVEDREAARAAFNALVGKGDPYLAIVLDSPGKSHQVRTFEEVEKVEKETGSVVVTLSPALVGG